MHSLRCRFFLQCGPRAWYGRFINKAFGIPTWGVRQTGHAAVLRWTHNVHWDICLGANVEKSYWDGDRCGWDFQLETQARNYCTSEMDHMYQVQRLEWMALLYNEKGDSVRQRSVPDVKSPWHALAFLQRYRLSRLHGLTNYVFRFEPSEPDTVPHNQTLTLHQKQQQNAIASEAVTYDGVTDSLIIPASVLSGGTTSNKVTVMPSFLGGQQVFVKEDATIEYTVNVPAEWKATSHGRQYSLTCRVATAHRSEQPIAVTVVSEGGSDKSNSSSSIVLPYTTGVWAETDPVAVTIESATSITIRLSRPNQPFGFSIKDLRLTPVRP
jgi:hypothetical protein